MGTRPIVSHFTLSAVGPQTIQKHVGVPIDVNAG